MSSHYFVKEDQEPALVIADLKLVNPEHIRQLLEWNPTVIVLERALEEFITWGVKFDVVICPHEKATVYAERLEHHAPLKLLTHHPDESAVTTAILFLLAGKYRAVNLAGVPPAELQAPYGDLDIVTFSSGVRWSFIRSGKFEKWMKQNEHLFFLPEAKLRKIGISDGGIVVEQGLVKITGDMPFWIGEPYA